MTIGDPQSFNRYSYVNNDPVNHVDALGLMLSDIGIVQTQDESYARTLQGASDSDFQRSVNKDYQSRHDSYLPTHVGVLGGSVITATGQFTHDTVAGESDGEAAHASSGDPQQTTPQPVDPCEIATQLPQNGVGFYAKGNTARRTQFAKGPTILWVLLFAEEWAQVRPDSPLGIGEISIRGGGKFGKHQGDAHKYGLGVDIRLPRLDRLDQGGFDYRSKGIYDQETTRQLVNALMADPAITRVYFNDPEITGSKIYRDSKGVHDNHLHAEVVDACSIIRR